MKVKLGSDFKAGTDMAHSDKVFFIRLVAMMLAIQEGPIVAGTTQTTIEARAEDHAQSIAHYLGLTL